MGVYKFPVETIRTFTEDTGKRYVAKAPVATLPQDLPLDVNAREQNLHTGVARAIRRSLTDRPDIFHVLNRGLVVTAESAVFDQASRLLSLHLTDPELHGILDGGHTYRVIVEALQKNPSLDAFVTVEILTGMEEYVADIVDARNTSVQVDAASLANVRNEFDPILDWLDAHGIKRNRIRVKQFDDEADIPILDVLAIMYCFDPVAFGTDKSGTSRPPLRAYSGKAHVLKHVRDTGNIARYTGQMLPLLPDILWLWDYVALRAQTHYRQVAGQSGRFFGRRGNQGGEQAGTYMPDLQVPSGFHPAYRYPLVAAMRCLVDTSGDQYRWRSLPSTVPDVPVSVRQSLKRTATPVERFYEWVAPDLMKVLAGQLDTSTPNKIGKSELVWNAMYTQAWLHLD